MILRVGVVICVASIVVALSHSSIARPGDQNQNKPSAAATGSAVVGIASTYNPFRPGYRSGGRETASGELYDPTAWTAAIQTNLRERFGGVRYGKNYRPTYALVSIEDKQVIVKVNDVGPLEPGRVIDLTNKRCAISIRICNADLFPSRSHHCVVLIGYQGLSRNNSS
jgi:rare lipoprotein A